MAQVTHPMPTVTAPGSLNATRMTFHPQTAATQFPWEEGHMQAHIVVIVVIFCGVCLLLLLAFFYAFCFHCSITSTPTDSHSSVRSGQDREDATFKCTSTEGLSIGNHI